MKTSQIALICMLFISALCYGQSTPIDDIKMTSKYLSDNQDLSDLMNFKNIAFYKLIFNSKKLRGASYRLVAKEMWHGELRKETLIANSTDIAMERIAYLQDTTFTMKVISELTANNELKMSFKFPYYGRMIKFDALQSDDYSLRTIPDTTGDTIHLDEAFNLLVYMLPYEKDGSKYWCAVEGSEEKIEDWGKIFGIEHYLIFEMIFESDKEYKDKTKIKVK